MNPYAFFLFVLVLSIYGDKNLASDTRHLLELFVPRLRFPMWLARIILAVTMSLFCFALFEILATPVQTLSRYSRNGAQTYQDVKNLAEEAHALKLALYNMTVLLGTSAKLLDRNLASHLRREVPPLDMLRGRLVQVSEEFLNASHGLLQDPLHGDFLSDLSKLTLGLFVLPFLLNIVGRFIRLVHVEILDTSPEHAAVAARFMRPPRLVLLPGKEEVPVSEGHDEDTANYLAVTFAKIEDVHKAVQDTRRESQIMIYESCRSTLAEFIALFTTSLSFRILGLLWLVLKCILQARYNELNATKHRLHLILDLGEIAPRKVEQMQKDTIIY